MGDTEASPFNGDIYPRIWFAGQLPVQEEQSISDSQPDYPVNSSTATAVSRPQAEETNNAPGGGRNGDNTAKKPGGDENAGTNVRTVPDNDEAQQAASTEEEGEGEQRLVIDLDEGSLDVDSEHDGKKRKRKSFRPQKYDPDSPLAATVIHDYAGAEGIEVADVEHVWKTPNEKQREYNREYKRKRRSNPEIRARERERQKEYQRLRRADPNFVAMEKAKRQNRQRGKTTDPEQIEKRRARQREYARSKRANPEYAAREREKNRLYQKQKREDPIYVAQEREKQRKRLESLREKRSDPEFAATEREKNRDYQRQKRMDPISQAKEKDRRKERLERIKADPEQWAKYQEAQKKRSKSRKTNRLSALKTETVHSQEDDPGEITQRSEIFHPTLYNQDSMVEGEITITYETVDSVMQNKNENESVQEVAQSDDGHDDDDDDDDDGHDDDDDLSSVNETVNGDDMQQIQNKITGTLDTSNVSNLKEFGNAVASSKRVEEEVIVQDSVVMDQNQDQDSSESELNVNNQTRQ